MRNTFWSILIAAVILLAGPGLFANETPIPGQAVIKLIPEGVLEDVITEFEGVPLDSIINARTFLVAFPDSFPVSIVIENLRNNPEIAYIQENFALGLPEVNQVSIGFPDESMPTYLYGEEPISYYNQPGTFATGLDTALQISDGSGVTVAVVDNGIDTSHPAFTDRLIPGYDFIENDADPSEVSGSMFGHGTFVSGLVLLAAPKAGVLPIRAFDGEGLGNTFSVAKAIYWALDHEADILNLSFGMYTDVDAIRLAIDSAVTLGAIVVSSVGNDAVGSPAYPAAYEGVIAVTAIDELDLVADFANYGSHVDIAAPGVDVYSCLAGSPYQWGTSSGTSFAVPFVSGTAALLLQDQPDIQPLALEQHLQSAARTETEWGPITVPHPYYGYGILDAWNTLLAYCRGDLDRSGETDISDVTAMVNFLFVTFEPPTPSTSLADFNCDGDQDISDLTGLVNHLFVNFIDPRPCY